jgi:hypothetical protein
MIAAATSGRLCLGVVTESTRFVHANGAIFVLLFHRQQSSLSSSCRHSITTEPQEPYGPVLAFTRPHSMAFLADQLSARLEALQRQSAITDRKVAATIKHCRELIAEHEAAEARWAAEHPDLV